MRRGLGDFNANITNSGYASAWAPVAAQLSAEGIGPGSTDLLAAQTAFDQAFTSLSGSLGGDAANAAAKYVMTGMTALGSLSQVVGLVQAGQSGEPPAGLLEGFTGTMIGVLTGAGAVSAGAGAAIVVAADVIISLLQQAGLFGSPAQGTNICGSTVSGNLPQYMMPSPSTYGGQPPTCIAVWDTYWDSTHNTNSIAPGSPAWRKFPVPSSNAFGGGPDAVWFVQNVSNMGGASRLQWSWTPKGAAQGVSYLRGAVFINSSQSIRLIDVAFPVYHHMECEAFAAIPLAPIPGDVGVYAQFQQAFFAALKLNWESAMNGIQPQPDYKVLIAVLRVWNRAHAPGAGVTLQPSSNLPIGAWEDCSNITPYEQICAQQAQGISPLPGDPAWDSSGALHVNTGARNVVPDTTMGRVTIGRVGVSLGPNSFKGSSASSATSSTVSTIAAGTAVVAGAGLLAAWLYARHKHVPVKTVLKSAWHKTGGKIHVPHHLPKLPKLLGRHSR